MDTQPPEAAPAAPFALAYHHLTGRYPQPAEWLAGFARKVWEKATEVERERCAGVAENGRFLHDDAPTAKFGREVAAAIRRGAS